MDSDKNVEELLFYANKLEKIAIEDLQLMKSMCYSDVLPRIAWDSQNRIICANEKFCKALGYEESDLLGKQFMTLDFKHSDFITPDTIRASVETIFENMSDGKEIFTRVVKNKWYNKHREEIPITWEIGFNNIEHGIGSAQCKIHV